MISDIQIKMMPVKYKTIRNQPSQLNVYKMAGHVAKYPTVRIQSIFKNITNQTTMKPCKSN